MYSTTSTDLQEQVASILSASCSVIILDFINVPLQSGSSDCGLYAIANATALVMGQNPASYQYDQKQMRSHLFQCLENQNITLFPVMRARRNKGNVIKAAQVVPVYCSCRMPETGEMIVCTKCNEWYHMQCCKNIPSSAVLSATCPWFCCDCN